MNSLSRSRASRRPTPGQPLSVGRIMIAVGLVAVVAAIATVSRHGSLSPTADADIVVYKMPSCGCCSLWVEHLRDSGLVVSVVNTQYTRSVRSRLGIPRELGSCHTAVAGDYWIEGHVPADLILELLANQPNNIRGLAVPGMPLGSPGMEAPNPVSYDVLSVDGVGAVSILATRKGKATRP